MLPDNSFNTITAGRIAGAVETGRGGPRVFQASLKFLFDGSHDVGDEDFQRDFGRFAALPMAGPAALAQNTAGAARLPPTWC